MRQRLLGVGTWVAALLLGTALFHALGEGSLAPPPIEPAAWGPWLEGRDPLIASMALLRLVVLGLCWYLVGVTTVGIVARLLRAARLIRFADALTLPIVRRLLEQSLGIALATTMVTAGAGSGPVVAALATTPAQVAAAAADEHEPAADDRGAADPMRPGAPGVGAPGVTLRGLPVSPGAQRLPLPWRIAEAGGAQDRSDAGPIEPTRRDGSVAEAPRGEDGTSPAIHTVLSGDSLWRIANAQLEDALGRSVTDAEIVPYWRTLITANRDRLPDRDDPDLILPGQELLLPPVVSA